MIDDKLMKILFVDDHVYLKEGVEKRVKSALSESHFLFSQDIKAARNIIIEKKVDLVICDLDFPEVDGFDGFYLMKSLKEEKINVKVIAFTSHIAYKILNKARKSGFQSYLLKSSSTEEFQKTIQSVILLENDGEYISDSMKMILKKRFKTQISVFSNSLNGISSLGEQEKIFLRYTAKTINRNTLAELMCKSPYTIDAYFKSIFKKLDISSRSETQFFAQEFYEKLE